MTPSAPVQQTVLITGGSSGIGFELAQLFARDGYRLVLVARGKEHLLYAAGQLREKFGCLVEVFANDLARPAAGEELVKALQQAGLAIDVLVNNAGYGRHGPFAESNMDEQSGMIEVNVASLTKLTRLLLPQMVRRRHGRILNVASTAAFQPGPLMAVYYASKAYVLSFSEALANELRGTGVTVTALCPGPTNTQFQHRAGMEHSQLFRRVMEAGSVARAGYHGLMRAQTVVVPGLRNRLLIVAVRLLPRSVVTRVVRGIQESREPAAGVPTKGQTVTQRGGR